MLFLTARCTRKACCISMTTGNCEMSSPVLAEKYLHSEQAFKCGDFSFFVWVLCFEMFAIIIQYTQNIECVVFYCTKPRLQWVFSSIDAAVHISLFKTYDHWLGIFFKNAKISRCFSIRIKDFSSSLFDFLLLQSAYHTRKMLPVCIL